jgi:Holliday junction resolvasome RuvABC endonuclease subunit
LRLLCLDLSTNAGWALIDDGKLLKFGNIRHKVIGTEEDPSYPRNYLKMAQQISSECWTLAEQTLPDLIIIEETNKGKNRYWQKQLEFIHYAVNDKFKHSEVNRIRYIDTSEWRKLLGLHLDKDQRTTNNVIKSQRDEVRDNLIGLYNKDHEQEMNLILSIPKKMARNRAYKKYLADREVWVKEKLRPFRSKIDGKVAGKIGVKNLSVNYVNEFYHLKFKKKDNDIADAICLGLAYIKKCSNTAPLE